MIKMRLNEFANDWKWMSFVDILKMINFVCSSQIEIFDEISIIV